MADGTSYSIDVAANSVGVSTSASELNALASALDSAGAVSTKFDSAVERTKALLTDASAASAAAAEAVASGANKYNQLQVAAEKAAKAVDKAAAAGKDTTALQANADAAAAALAAQGTALEALKGKAKSAAEEEKRLAATMKTLSGAAREEAAALNGAAAAAERSGAKEAETFKRALGPYGEKLERLRAMKSSFGVAGMAGIGAAALWLVAAAALVAVAAAAAGAVFELAKFAVTSNPKAMKALEAATAKARKGIASLFKDVRVDGFVEAYKTVASVFDEGSAEASAMKTLVETLLDPLFDAAKTLGPYLKAMFRGLIYAALQAAIAVVRLRNAILRAIPDSVQAAIAAVASSVDWLEVAFWGGVVAAGVLALALAALVAVVAIGALVIGGVLFLALMVVIAPFILAAIVIAVVIAALYGLGVAVAAAAEWLVELASSAADAASNLVTSFVSQIEAGAGMVADAMRALGEGGINALKSALGIASPSKYALSFARNVTDTMSSETDRGAGDVQASLGGMIGEPPDAPPARAGASGAGASGASVTLSGPFNFYGVADAEQAEGRFEAMLTRVLRGDVEQLGAPA